MNLTTEQLAALSNYFNRQSDLPVDVQIIANQIRNIVTPEDPAVETPVEVAPVEVTPESVEVAPEPVEETASVIDTVPAVDPVVEAPAQ